MDHHNTLLLAIEMFWLDQISSKLTEARTKHMDYKVLSYEECTQTYTHTHTTRKENNTHSHTIADLNQHTHKHTRNESQMI